MHLLLLNSPSFMKDHLLIKNKIFYQSNFCADCGTEIKNIRRFHYPKFFCADCRPRFLPYTIFRILFCAFLMFGGLCTGYYLANPVLKDTKAVANVAVLSPMKQQENLTNTEGHSQKPFPALVERVCGAKTHQGKSCKRRVRGPGYCWQHRKPSSP